MHRSPKEEALIRAVQLMLCGGYKEALSTVAAEREQTAPGFDTIDMPSLFPRKSQAGR